LAYPGWYQGRATHIHVEVTVAGRSVKVTQIAFPESINNQVHTSGVYAARGTNPTTNARDGIFSDSLNAELVTPTGSVAGGYSGVVPDRRDAVDFAARIVTITMPGEHAT
jgi:hypothetical protein